MANTSLPSFFFPTIPSNPGGILGKPGMVFNLNYTNYLAGIQYGSLAHLVLKEDFSYSSSLQYLTSGDMRRTDPEGKGSTYFSFSAFTLSFSTARKVAKVIHLGLNSKFLYANCDTFRTAGIAIDLGCLFTPSRAKISLLFKNIGFQFDAFYKEKDQFPNTFRTDIGYLIFDNLTIETGIEKFATDPINFRLGAEGNILNLLFIRGSYSTLKDDVKTGSGSDIFANFALGLSVQKLPFRLDYAFSPFLSLGNTHTFSLTFLLR